MEFQVPVVFTNTIPAGASIKVVGLQKKGFRLSSGHRASLCFYFKWRISFSFGMI